MLQPTDTALLFHKMQAKYVTIMFKKSLQLFTPSLSLVTDCVWKIDDGILIPIMTDMLPAPSDGGRYREAVGPILTTKWSRDMKSCEMASRYMTFSFS